ncbi:MAG: hypothetical protein V5A58_12355 [Salinibacter sp.]|uniref:hypothetical protein n=1 Tax=Salinibacter sp. TaxID=2065818 RepID=UPI002FC2C186
MHLNGGRVRNAALQATLLALDEAGESTSPTKTDAGGEGIHGDQENVERDDEHLFAAVRDEYQKDGAVCPLTVEDDGDPSSGAQQFVEGMTA